jgi:hypothetical protein
MDWEKHFRAMKRSPNLDFGAMARGTPQGDGAVIPPGRYWIDAFNEKRDELTAWKKGKPEVKFETTEEDLDTNRLFVIFSIPKTASNFGLPGVWFPTKSLGFPTIADTTVQSSDDTVQKPPAPTSADVLTDIASGAGQVGSGFLGQLNTDTIIKFALVAGIVIFAATTIPNLIAKKML